MSSRNILSLSKRGYFEEIFPDNAQYVLKPNLIKFNYQISYLLQFYLVNKLNN